MKNLSVIYFIIILFFGCGVDKEDYYDKLEKDLSRLEQLRLLIINKYQHRLSMDDRPGIVFFDCTQIEMNIDAYICDDQEILSEMKSMGLREIGFRKKVCEDNAFSNIYFQVSKNSYYPIVYYVYKECGTGDFFESKTIYYRPLNDNWALLVDSNFP